MTKLFWRTTFFCLLSICSANSLAQSATTSLRGIVKDPTGAVVSGATTSETSTRFTDRHTLPFTNGAAPPTQIFPYPAPEGNFAITWGLDSKMKTPYSEAFDLSVQRQLPGGFTVEAAYVGRLGRHLLQSLDLAEPVDFVDPQGGGDYFSAGAQLSAQVDRNGGDPDAVVSNIPYFEHLFPFMANVDFPGESATQAALRIEFVISKRAYLLDEATLDYGISQFKKVFSLFQIDFSKEGSPE